MTLTALALVTLAPLLVVVGFSLLLAEVAWFRRSHAGARPFAGMMIVVAGWTLTYVFELLSNSTATKEFWANVKFTFIALMPITWVSFAAAYTGRRLRLDTVIAAAAMLEGLLFVALVWTNPWHGFFRIQTWLEEFGPLSVLRIRYGPVFWANAVLAYAFLTWASVLLFDRLFRSGRLFRRQGLLVLTGLLAPWVGNALFVFRTSPFPQLDLTPFGFAVTGPAMAVGLLRFRLLDFAPSVGSWPIDDLADAVIVLDRAGYIADLNRAAARLIGGTVSDLVGAKFADVHGHWSGDLQLDEDFSLGGVWEFFVGEAGLRRDFELQISPLVQNDGRSSGRILVIRDVTERKRAEDALAAAVRNAMQREAAEVALSRFRNLIENAPDALIAFDEARRITLVNRTASFQLGYGTGELVGCPFGDLAVAPLPEWRISQGSTDVDLTIRRKDGARLSVEANFSEVATPDGVWTIAALRDVSRRRRWDAYRVFLVDAGKALSSALSNSDGLMEIVRVAKSGLADCAGIVSIDEAGQLRSLAIDPADWDLLELLDELQVRFPQNPRLSVLARTVQLSGEPLLQPVVTGVPLPAVESDLLERASISRVLPHSMMIVPLSSRGAGFGLLVLCSTIAARAYDFDDLEAAIEFGQIASLALDNLRLYQEAEEERRSLQIVIDQMPAGVVIQGEPGEGLLMNDIARRLSATGEAGPTDAGGEMVFDMRSSDGVPLSHYERPLYRAQTTGEPTVGRELGLVTANGRVVPVIANSAPIEDRTGTRRGAVMVFQDVSAVKSAERQQREMLSMLAHDVKAPIATIRAIASGVSLKGIGAMDRAIEGHRETILEESRRVTRLVDDLLDLARIQAHLLDLETEVVHPVDLVAEFRPQIEAMTINHNLEIDVSLELPTITGDVDYLGRVLTNLVGNAAKYSPKGTTIAIRAARNEDRRALIFSVSDEGVGISTDDQQDIFENLERSRETGPRPPAWSGVGLAIAKGIVELHGGHIWVQAELGAGSTFAFCIPTNADESGDDAVPADASAF